MSAPIRFWGYVRAIRPRVIVAWLDGERTVTCPGFIVTIDGTLAEDNGSPVSQTFTVALGPATAEKRHVGVGDLLRGDAHRVPENTPDVPADLYKVGILRTIAPGKPFNSDPPRTDPPLAAEAVPNAPRRALRVANIELGGPCALCPHAVLACVVRLSDPRQPPRSAPWTHVPACLGPIDCPYPVHQGIFSPNQSWSFLCINLGTTRCPAYELGLMRELSSPCWH